MTTPAEIALRRGIAFLAWTAHRDHAASTESDSWRTCGRALCAAARQILAESGEGERSASSDLAMGAERTAAVERT